MADQYAANTRGVVASVERAQAPADIGLEPAGEIHRGIDRWNTDVAEIAGAIAGRDVHATAECDGQVGVVAAHAGAFAERLPSRLGWARVVVAEGDMAGHRDRERAEQPPPPA